MSYEDYKRNRQRREAYARRYRTEGKNIFGEPSLLYAIGEAMVERKQRQAREARAKAQAATQAERPAAGLSQIQAGAVQAKRWAEANIPDCVEALSAEFTGQDAVGGLHYRVTYVKPDGSTASAGPGSTASIRPDSTASIRPDSTASIRPDSTASTDGQHRPWWRRLAGRMYHV
jgi:hypothetical protein